MAKNNGGCTFGLVLEQRVSQMEKSTMEIKDMVNDLKKTLGGRMTELFNHQSSHVPQAVITQINMQWKIITILSTITAALISGVLARIIL